MGNTNAQSLTRLQEDTMNGYYDAILHVGDFAYNMDDVTIHSIYATINISILLREIALSSIAQFLYKFLYKFSYRFIVIAIIRKIMNRSNNIIFKFRV